MSLNPTRGRILALLILFVFLQLFLIVALLSYLSAGAAVDVHESATPRPKKILLLYTFPVLFDARFRQGEDGYAAGGI